MSAPRCTRPPRGWACTRDEDHDGPCAAIRVDLELLGKLAKGVGGERTGNLRKAGFLTWRVTPAGLAALGLPPPPPQGACPWHQPGFTCPLCR